MLQVPLLNRATLYYNIRINLVVTQLLGGNISQKMLELQASIAAQDSCLVFLILLQEMIAQVVL